MLAQEKLDTQSAGERWPARPRDVTDGFLVLCLAALVAAYLLLILVAPRFGPIDDHMLITALRHDAWLPPMIDPATGRFCPLNGQDLNLVSFLGTIPLAYYAINAVELALLVLVFYDLTRGIVGRKAAFLCLIVLLLGPGFATAWLRLFISERRTLLLFVIFLWCYTRFAERRSALLFIGALVSANVAFYFKEPGFVMLGAFAALRLFGAAKVEGGDTRKLDMLLILSVAAYVLVYYFVVYRHRGAVLYGKTSSPPLLHEVKNFATYATEDPVLLFLALPVGIGRAVALLRRKVAFEPLADALLFSALSYAAAYVALDLSAPYYLLPAYAFALPALLWRWRRRERPTRRLWIAGLAVVSFVLVTTTVPLALYTASYWKYVPRNFTSTVDFLSADIAARADEHVARIYLDGVNPASGAEIYSSLADYLVAAGLPQARFDLSSTESFDEPAAVVASQVPPSDRGLDTFTHPGARTPRTGDYLVVSPFTQKNSDAAYLATLGRDYRLVFRTVSPYALSRVDLQALMKHLALRFARTGALRLPTASGNNLTYSVDYAVFVRR